MATKVSCCTRLLQLQKTGSNVQVLQQNTAAEAEVYGCIHALEVGDVILCW